MKYSIIEGRVGRDGVRVRVRRDGVRVRG